MLTQSRKSLVQATEHFLTVSQVRVVTFLPKVFSISATNTGPRDPET